MSRIPFYPDLRRRTDMPERMDARDSDPVKLARTLEQFDRVNRLFSRAQFLLRRFVLKQMALDPAREYHLIDLGAGACDLAAWLLEASRIRGLRLRVTACDHDPRVVAFARARYGDNARLSIVGRDVRELSDLPAFDFVFANHLLHHLDDARLGDLFARLAGFPSVGILFNDLRRTRLAYSAYYLLSPLLFADSFARYDGLLSIRKGFREDELDAIITQSTGGRLGAYTLFKLPPNRIVFWRPPRKRV